MITAPRQTNTGIIELPSQPDLRSSHYCLQLGLTAGTHLLRLAGVVHALERIAHVFDLLPERGVDEDGLALGGGEGEAIARARVEFDEFAAEFVLLLENDAGKVGGVLQVGDDDALHGDAEALEDVLDEFVRERAFGALILEIHGDDLAHVGIHADHEDFVLVADENGAARVGWQNPANLNLNDIFHPVGL